MAKPPRKIIACLKPADKNLQVYHYLEQTIGLFLILCVFVFILWPVLSVLIKSFYEDGQIDFSCYKNLFTKNSRLLYNSIFIASLSTILSVLSGICVALYLSHTKNPWKKIVFATLLLTMISPPFVSSLAYIMLFGKRGLITYKLLGLCLNPYGWHGIVLMQVAGYTTLTSLMIYGVLKGVDRNLEKASLDLGAGNVKTLFQVTLPLVKPGIIVAALIAFVKSLSDFGTPIIIGGGFNVLATESYLNVIGLYNLRMASSMSVLLLVPALVAFFIYRRQLKKGELFSSPKSSEGMMPVKITGILNIIIFCVTWGFILFEILKYSTIFYGMFAKTWGFNYSFTLNHLKAVNPDKIACFLRSIKYALMAGVIGSFFGILLSYLLGRKKLPCSGFIDFLSTLPYMIPGTFFGIGYVISFHNDFFILTGTAFLVIANCVFRQLPISTKAGTAVLTQIDPELEHAASDLGAGQFGIMKDIILPLMKPAFLVSFLNTFTTTMTTIGAIIFIISPSSKVATIVMFDAIKNGNISEGAVYANILTLVVMIINVSFTWLLFRKRKKGI